VVCGRGLAVEFVRGGALGDGVVETSEVWLISVEGALEETGVTGTGFVEGEPAVAWDVAEFVWTMMGAGLN
jgi:hypothetical protein